MDASLRHLLSELEEAGRRNDEQEQDRSRKMLNLEPETAHLLSVLVRSSRRTRLLEIGTSNGYSTIWLAWELALLLPKLTVEALLFADNVLSHPQEIADYLAAVEALPQFDHLVVPVGKGLSIAYRQKD